MAKPPRKHQWIARRTRAETSRLPGPVVAPRPADTRQSDLFRPAFIPPCKPVLRGRLPTGPAWRYEIKHDGYRIQAHTYGGEVRLFTKSGFDWTDRMPAIRDDMLVVGGDVILDGEAVILGQDGIADFFALMPRSRRKALRWPRSTPSTSCGWTVRTCAAGRWRRGRRRYRSSSSARDLSTRSRSSSRSKEVPRP